MTRLPPNAPLTPAELRCVRLVAAGRTYDDIATLEGISRNGVLWRMKQAAKKIPGTLPMQAKCKVWWQGGNLAALGS